MWNSPGSPDPKIWAYKKDVDSAHAKLRELEPRLAAAETVLAIVAKDVKFSVKYSNNGGSGSMADTVFVGIASSQALPACTMTRTGHSFAGWNTKADGTGKAFADQAVVRYIDFAEEAGDVTLYAQWTAAVYNVTYVLPEGWTGNENPATYTYGVGIAELSVPTGAAAGKRWKNWKNGSTVVTSIGTDATGDITLTGEDEDVPPLATDVRTASASAGKLELINTTSNVVITSEVALADVTALSVVVQAGDSEPVTIPVALSDLHTVGDKYGFRFSVLLAAITEAGRSVVTGDTAEFRLNGESVGFVAEFL